MKKSFAVYLCSAFILFAAVLPVSAGIEDYGFRPIREPMHTKEDFFTKYVAHLVSTPDYVSRNIFFLELAYTIQWDDPIRALVPCTNEIQYEKYQNLLMMHICLMLTREYINYGYLYFKEHIYWYNFDYVSGETYLKGYQVAEKYFNDARHYWDQTIHFAQMADSYTGWHMNDNFTGIHIPFEDEVYKIKTGDPHYDFYAIIDNLMGRLQRNRAEVQSAISNQRAGQ